MSPHMTDHHTTTVPFEAPTAGSWELDLAHFSPDVSRIVRDGIEFGMRAGIEDGFVMIGAPVETMEAHFLNGRFYRRLVPLVGASRDLPPPPDIAVKVLSRLHPGFRRRTKTAAKALSERIWLNELRRWEDEWKPELIATSRSIARLDPASLSDDALADAVERANEHVRAGLRLHFRLHISDLGPIGLLLVKTREWGLDSVEVMQALSGFSEATSAPAIALAQIRALAPGDLQSLDDVRAAGPEAERALDDFLLDFGHRLTGGYDISELTLAEMPDTILAGIRATDPSADSVDEAARRRGESIAAELRAKVPASERERFDEMLADARALYGLRDENGPITYQWPAGLLRGLVLETGERLAASGRIKDADHVLDLTAAEMAEALRGSPSPDRDEVSQRHTTRQSWLEIAEAPRLLGPEPILPPISALPGPLADLMDCILTVLEMIESPLDRAATDQPDAALVGTGIGTERATGRARVVTDAVDALSDFEPRDILVTPFTVPTINSVLAMAGGIVTEEGGLLSHAAVIAREFGIPAVIGIDRAASRIADGASIEVNAGAGTVTVLTT